VAQDTTASLERAALELGASVGPGSSRYEVQKSFTRKSCISAEIDTLGRARLKLWSDFVMQETARQYHRRSRRIHIGQPVKLIPSVPGGERFEEIGTTSNVSAEGFYFLTKREHYQRGMRLQVTLPYRSPRDRSDREYLAQVVRIELLDDGQRGVAVHLLSSVGGPP